MTIPTFKRTTLIAAACGAFLVGLWLAHIGLALTFWLSALAAASLLGWRRAAWLPLIIAALLLGIVRGHVAVDQTRRVESLFGQKVWLVGIISDDPIVTDKNYTEFSMRSQIPGEVKVRTHYMRLQRGYRLEAVGVLEPVKGSKTAQIGFASSVQVTSSQLSWIEQLRQRFFAGIRTALPEPLSSFGLGLLMGTRALIPRALQDQLALVGLSHLVAVSGYNLTILTDSIRFRRGSAFVRLALPIWIVGAFCVVTGFSASIVRAAVVSILGLLAMHYGRQFKPMVVLGLSAVITTLWQPSYLWADLGWQLSFLAFFGILVVAPAILGWFRQPHPLLAIGVESLAAQIMTAPLIIMTFGTVSLVAPFTNLLVLPLIPLAMALSLFAGLGGMLLPRFAPFIGLPANWLLQAVVSFIERASGITWASYNLVLAPVIIVMLYVCICLLVVLGKRRYNRGIQETGDSRVGTFKMEHN